MSRPRPGRSAVRRRAVLLGAALAALAAAAEAPGQEPRRPPLPPRDTAGVADTLGVPTDSAAADTLGPVDVVRRFPHGGSPSWRAGIWEWDRPALQASGAVTLTDLLERIPGVQPFRYGLFGHPETVGAWGLTAGRLEVVLDGFALDPLDAGVQDLSRLELAALDRVRVERDAGRLRIELETIAPSGHRPYSMVEAGTGQPDDAKVFRGVFQTPRFLGGPLSLAVDRVDSDGLGRNEPANTFSGWAKWARVVGSTALQLELRRAGVERTLANGAVVDGSRQDWVLRARGAPTERTTAEAFFGASRIDDGLASAPGDGEGDARTRLRSVQAGVRGAFQADRAWTRATVRLRSQRGLPGVEAELAGGVRAPGPLRLGGTVAWADWAGESGVAYGARAELGPILGLTPVAEISAGRRGVPFLARDPGDAAVFTDRTSLRLGGDLGVRGLHLGGAFLVVSADSVPSFELPFDRGVGLYPGGELRGWEVTGRIPLFWEPLALEGWHVRWIRGAPWIYLPAESWRAALVYSDSPLESGNLEVLARIEARHRGAMNVPSDAGATAPLPPFTAFDFYLQLRILDVRAFLRWENLTLRPDLEDFPGRTFPRQRVFYGVKWEFWN